MAIKNPVRSMVNHELSQITPTNQPEPNFSPSDIFRTNLTHQSRFISHVLLD